MRLLLDSHALLWWHDGSLAARTRSWLESGEADVYVSVITPWELGVKQAKGKLRLDKPVDAIVDDSHFLRLPVRWSHAEAAASLPAFHGDPFDRMLVAQAQLEGLSLVTDDLGLGRYHVHVVPAR